MPLMKLVPPDISEPPEIVAAIRRRRGGTLFNLDLLLLNSPELAAGWNVFLGAVRQRLSLPPKIRELAICAVAILNKADYERIHHVPVLLAAGGTRAQVDALDDVAAAACNEGLFNVAERATLQFSYEMTRQVEVQPSTLKAVREALADEQMLVELAAVIAAYNMVSRMIVVSDLPIESHNHPSSES